MKDDISVVCFQDDGDKVISMAIIGKHTGFCIEKGGFGSFDSESNKYISLKTKDLLICNRDKDGHLMRDVSHKSVINICFTNSKDVEEAIAYLKDILEEFKEEENGYLNTSKSKPLNKE